MTGFSKKKKKSSSNLFVYFQNSDRYKSHETLDCLVSTDLKNVANEADNFFLQIYDEKHRAITSPGVNSITSDMN
jgi:hypothetical protein